MRLLSPLVSIALAWAVASSVLAQSTARPAPSPPQKVAPSGLKWGELTTRQKTALAPLKDLWPTLDIEHQRKWVALARNYHRLSPDEQLTLQRRMSEWAQLSPAQRTRARLNFGEARRVPADEKRSQWKAYQALPEQERERLAADRPKPPVTTAPALRPVPPSKIVRPIRSNNSPSDGASRDARANTHLNRNTLLPEQPSPPQADRSR